MSTLYLRRQAIETTGPPPSTNTSHSVQVEAGGPARPIALTLVATLCLGLTVPLITGHWTLAIPLIAAPLFALFHILVFTLAPLCILQQLAGLRITPRQTTQAMVDGMEHAARLTLAILPVMWFMGTGGGMVSRWLWVYYLGGSTALLIGLHRARGLMLIHELDHTAPRFLSLAWVLTAFLIAIPAALDTFRALGGL